jgi:acyl-[acyl-carrier-protein]-phospholipid O-acyltransferase/long-chain-fatty-acid--[acyl-carrier-protein] ligase
MKSHLSESLTSRTFIGLLLAQFTATFNDQAIHMVAVFYSVDMVVRFAHVRGIDDKKVIAIVTACFMLPFLMFSSYAGALGDRFSKRSVIVFWKVAEVFMMGLALLGLSLPHFVAPDSPSLPALAVWSSILVISTVFLMGMHSTFFVPAKLGAMPEILHPSILSRGNGVLEGTSFTAQILGTSTGGILYSVLKGDIAKGEFGDEWMIGTMLLGLALVGTVTAFLMRPIPPAAPDRRLSWNWWRPLQGNLAILWRSKPLTLSVTGIAFCVFMTVFLRQTLLYQGELDKELRTARAAEASLHDDQSAVRIQSDDDRSTGRILPDWLHADWLEKAAQEPELRVALLFAMVGLGVGLGSVLAGYLSGHRIELGLVPVGALVIIVCTVLPGLPWDAPALVGSPLFGIGCGAGFYLVPLYTQLQHRAPKESKGNVVAASNFLNVVGGIVAVAVFYALAFAFEWMLGPAPDKREAFNNVALLPALVSYLQRQRYVPRLLFMSTTVMTFWALMRLTRRLPDFYLRTAIWIRAMGHNTLRTIGIEHMPTNGPVLLLTNCHVFPAVLDLVAAVDRYPHIVLVEKGEPERSWLRKFARRSELVSIPAVPGAPDWARALQSGRQTLQKGEMVALNVNQPDCAADVVRLIDAWRSAVPEAVVLPVCATAAVSRSALQSDLAPVYPRVIFGPPLSPQIPLASVVAAIEKLASAAESE